MMYRLIILNGDRKGEQITLTQDPMIVGRAERCDIRLNDPEIALSHAEITHKPDGLHIRDLGSMNRFLINNREVHEAQPKHGDVVEMGHTRFLIQAYVQAEVQASVDAEEDSDRRKPWLVGSGIILFVAGLLVFVPRCERWMISPRTRTIKTVPAKLTPPAVQQEPSRPAPVSVPTPASAPIPSVQPTNPPLIVTPVKTEPAPAVHAPAIEVKPPTPPPQEALAEPEAPPPPHTTNRTSELINASQQELQAAMSFLERGTGVTEKATEPSPAFTPQPAVTAAIPAPVIAPPKIEAAPIAIPVVPKQQEAKQELVRPATTGLIKITGTDINKFPETEQFREMRLLTIRLTSLDTQKELDPGAVRVEVVFADQDKTSGQIMPATPGGVPGALTVKGKWQTAEQKTLVASYVVPASSNQTERLAQYYGFMIRVYYYGTLQDELSQPRDLSREVVFTPAHEAKQ